MFMSWRKGHAVGMQASRWNTADALKDACRSQVQALSCSIPCARHDIGYWCRTVQIKKLCAGIRISVRQAPTAVHQVHACSYVQRAGAVGQAGFGQAAEQVNRGLTQAQQRFERAMQDPQGAAQGAMRDAQQAAQQAASAFRFASLDPVRRLIVGMGARPCPGKRQDRLLTAAAHCDANCASVL